MPDDAIELMPSKPASQWRDRKGIAAHFAISERHVTNLQRRRILPYVRLGRAVRFDVHACDQALKALEIKSIVCLTPFVRV